jgi:hypothetical protein
VTPLLIKSFKASAAIGGYLIAKADATNKTVSAAAAATDRLVGITDGLGVEAGGMADLVQVGWAELKLGGNVAFGNRLTADANGCGVAVTAPDYAASACTIAVAMDDGVSGDIIPVLLAPGILATPAEPA